jgi:class 3 adenylate cyclase/tetratricopeptide (TPR) repeat protein
MVGVAAPAADASSVVSSSQNTPPFAVGRSTVIVLFTDQVGSTRLRSSVGEERAEEIRRRHDRLVTEAIEGNRGRVVKHLGDGMMANFAGASDATAAAVGIQQGLDRHNRSAPRGERLEVRVGLSAGDVAVEDGDCFGTPVIEAARLCAAARGGQILVSEIVRLLAGSIGGLHFTPVGAMDLKGLPEPLPACEVAWDPAPASLVPMPALLTDVASLFVGRENEVARLRRLWEESAAGELRVALLTGEPGVGKTRLAAEIAREAHEAGALVLVGRCDEDLGVPFQPFVEALRYFLDHSPGEDLGAQLGRHAGELVRLVPELADRVSGLGPPLRSDPETERYRLFDAVAAWMAAVSAEVPVLLVLDDLQWAAKPTLLLLRHFVRSADVKRVLALGTYRDTELGRGHPLLELLADLRRQAGVERLVLPGLDEPAIVAFVEQTAGHALSEDGLGLARAIHQETDGNPFFVREVLHHLSETGAVERHDGWVNRLPVDELGIPEGVRDVVGRRLSRLSEEANRTLRRAAVVGAEFDLPVLQAAGDAPDESVLLALEEAVSAHLVLEVPGPVPRYRFTHALVRDTLYDDLSAARRTTHHRRVAAAIEAIHGGRLDDQLPALAHHWARASTTSADRERAVDYAIRAGDRALVQLAHDEAVAYYRQALDLLGEGVRCGSDSRHLDVIIALGEAQQGAGQEGFRQTLLDAAALATARHDAGALARAALANTRGMYVSVSGVVDVERVAVLESALAVLSPDDSPVRAELLATLALELTFSGARERRVALSDEALAMARRLGDPGTLVRVLARRHYTLGDPSTLGQRLAAAAELLALTEGLGGPVSIAWAWWLRARAGIQAGEVDETRQALDRAEAIATDLGHPTLQWFAAMMRGTYLPMTGRLEEAERQVLEAARLGESTGQPDAALFLTVGLFAIRFGQGRLDEVVDRWESAVARYPDWPVLRCGLGMIYSELDRDDEARAILDALATAGFTDIPFDAVWLPGIASAGLTATHLGDEPRAAMLYDLLSPYPTQIVFATSGCLGSVAQHLGMLATTTGRFCDAEEHFRAAEATHARLGARQWLAWTWLEWARMLLARRQPGDLERAHELLAQALGSARELRLRNIERRALALAG